MNSLLSIFLVLNIFLLIPFLGYFLRMFTLSADLGDTISKIIRALLIYFSLLIILIKSKGVKIRNNSIKYFILLLFFSAPYFLHFFVSGKSGVEHYDNAATRELILLSATLLVFLMVSSAKFTLHNWLFLMPAMLFLGIFLGVYSFWFAINYSTKIPAFSAYDFTRAGLEVTDPNYVGALLNILSLSGIYLFLTTGNFLAEYLSILAFLIIQVDRVFTFSNGSLVNSIISLLLLIALIDDKKYKKKLYIIFGFLILLTIFIFISNLKKILFYRIPYWGESLEAQRSFLSRFEQLTQFTKLINDNPLLLLYGLGSARLPIALGLNHTIHNAPIRSLAIGGILSFSSFLCLWLLTYKNFKHSIKHCKNEKLKIMLIILLSAFIGWSVQSLTLPADVSALNLFFWSLAYSLANTVRESFNINTSKLHYEGSIS